MCSHCFNIVHPSSTSTPGLRTDRIGQIDFIKVRCSGEWPDEADQALCVSNLPNVKQGATAAAEDRAFFCSGTNPNIYFSNRKVSSTQALQWPRFPLTSQYLYDMKCDAFAAVQSCSFCLLWLWVSVLKSFLTLEKLVWICVSLSHQLSRLVETEGFGKRVKKSFSALLHICFIPVCVCACCVCTYHIATYDILPVQLPYNKLCNVI